MLNDSKQNGFALVVVLIMSTALIVLALSLLQTVDIVRTNNMSRYYAKLAEDASEAGTAYAKGCIEANGRTQSWTGTLAPDKTCAGTAGTTSQYVLNTSTVQTTFTVGNLEQANANSVIIAATGISQVKIKGTATVIKTYTQTTKRKIVWDPDLTSQQSSSGTTRTCGILGGNVYCWGTNTYGQLGNNTQTDSPTPVKLYRDPTVLGTKKILNIVSGSYFNCVIASDNAVYCWGKNESYQLGNTGSDSMVPILVPGLAGKVVTGLGASSSSVCALITNGDVYCWGANQKGQLGAGLGTSKVAVPTLVAGPSLSASSGSILAGKSIIKITNNGTFNDSFCAIDSTYKAYCWGANAQGELGIGTTGGNSNTPKAVITTSALSGKKIIDIQSDGNDVLSDVGTTGDLAYGDSHTCVVAYTTTPNDAKAYCWGSNRIGNLGNNGVIGKASNTFPAWIYNTPQAVDTTGVLSGKTITSVATGDAGSCVTAYPTGGSANEQRAYCWGPNYAVGNGGPRSSVPVQVDDGNGIFLNNKIDNLVGGADRFCARAIQTAYCWGANAKGQIGTGLTTPSTVRQPAEALFLRPLNNEFIY